MAVGASRAASADVAARVFSLPYATPFAGELADGARQPCTSIAAVGYAAQGAKVAAVADEVVVRKPSAALAVVRAKAVLSSAAVVNPAAVVDVSVAVARKDGDAGELVRARLLDVWNRAGC